MTVLPAAMSRYLAGLLLASCCLCALPHQTLADYVAGTPHSAPIELDRGTFQAAIQDPANGLWLLKFYAPWCGHCKRMKPILDEIAPALKGQLAIGKIDCTTQKQLCNEFSVRGYPTLKVARDGNIFDYPGGRSKEDIIGFAEKMNAPAVEKCDTYHDALAVATTTSKDGIVFVAHHPAAKGETLEETLQSTHLTQVFAQVARMEQAFASFCFLSELTPSSFGFQEEETPPNGFIAKVESSVPPKVLQPASSEDVDTQKLLQFVRENNVPLVAELGAGNFKKLAHSGRKLLVAVVEGSDQLEQVTEYRRQLTEYALEGAESIVNQYYFAWMDGKRWHKFLEQFNVTSEQLPQVVAMDVPNKQHWQDASVKTVKDFVNAIENGSVPMQFTGKNKVKTAVARAKHAFLRYLPWSALGVIALFCVLLIIIFPSSDKMRPPYPKQGDAKKATDGASGKESKKEK